MKGRYNVNCQCQLKYSYECHYFFKRSVYYSVVTSLYNKIIMYNDNIKLQILSNVRQKKQLMIYEMFTRHYS